MQLSQADFDIVDETSALCAELWSASRAFSGLNTSPEMHSVMLFRRLRNNHRAFMLLWKQDLETEAAMILRAAIEATIGLAANNVLRDEFVQKLRQDAVFTIVQHSKMFQKDRQPELVRAFEAQRRQIAESLPSDTKPAKLHWEQLASAAGVSDIYSYYPALSGQFAHVTGLSIIRGVVGADGTNVDKQSELAALDKSLHLMLMTVATLQGCRFHAGMLKHADLAAKASALLERLNLGSGPINRLERRGEA